MKQEFLDEDFFLDAEKKNLKKTGHIIVLLLLWFAIGLCIFKGMVFNFQILLAFVLLIISTVTSYYNLKKGIQITFVAILLGLLNLIIFSPINYLFTFTLFQIGLSFNLGILAIGLIHFFTNRKILSEFISSFFRKKEALTLAETNSRVLGFKRRFSKRDISELEEIVNNNLLVPEAIQAATELIIEKKQLSRGDI